LFQHLPDRCAVVDQHPFGQLKLQPARAQAVAIQRLRHQRDESRVGQLPRRDVDADGHLAWRAAAPLRHLAACLVQHPRAQFDDHAAVLGDRE
jgi:hypothetical protein